MIRPLPVRRPLSSLVALVLAAALVPAGGIPPVGAQEVGDYQQVLDITFPTVPTARFGDDYDAPRGGGTRVHKATDLVGDKHDPLYSVVDGTICHITGIDEPEPSWGYSLSVCDSEGRRYRYIHMNNDTPGTDDGQGGPQYAYAPGVRRGAKVARGQLVGWMGDSGNAENTVDHLHFEIFDERVLDPYGDTRINPYPSLTAALQRGDIPDGTAMYIEETGRVAGEDRVATAIALSQQAFPSASHAIIASARNPSAAIVAGSLAAAVGGPVLTTEPGFLDERVVAELERLGVERVTVVGTPIGTEVVGPALGLGPDAVDRVGNADPFATSAAVARRVWEVLDQPAVDVGALPEALNPSLPPLDLDGLTDPVIAATVDGTTGTLDGAVLEVRRTVIELRDPAHDLVDKVRFYVNRDADGQPDQTENHDPYNLGSRDGRETRRLLDSLGTGTHTVHAVVQYLDGSERTVTATFEVVGSDADVTPTGRSAVVALGQHPDPSRSWPDSLMASYYGAAMGRPVLLLEHNRVPQSIREALVGVGSVTIIGGPAAVTAEQAAVIDGIAGQVGRVWGETRYSTALAVTDELITGGFVDGSEVWGATGRNWPDAATSGPVVAAKRTAMVLVDGEGLGADHETSDWLTARAGRLDRAVAIGGPAAVADRALVAFGLWIT